jgi:hypothetical protein
MVACDGVTDYTLTRVHHRADNWGEKEVYMRLMLIACLFCFTVGTAQAQEVAEVATIPAASASPAQTTDSFDGYRALIISAGVIGGAAVAAILTDGLIVPVLSYLAGGEAAGAAVGAGAGRMAVGTSHHSYSFLRGSLRLLGAVSGGLYADSKYTEGATQ